LLSYSRGPDYPLLEITIGEQLRRTAIRVGDSLAVVSCHQSRGLTWVQPDDVSDRLARGLWSLGIRKANRVGLWSSNCVEWVMVQMACARAGAILVNINPAYRSHELRFSLSKSRMKAIFLRRSDGAACRRARERIGSTPRRSRSNARTRAPCVQSRWIRQE
jgi:fatty-acyl-CoA synthase